MQTLVRKKQHPCSGIGSQSPVKILGSVHIGNSWSAQPRITDYWSPPPQGCNFQGLTNVMSHRHQGGFFSKPKNFQMIWKPSNCIKWTERKVSLSLDGSISWTAELWMKDFPLSPFDYHAARNFCMHCLPPPLPEPRKHLEVTANHLQSRLC